MVLSNYIMKQLANWTEPVVLRVQEARDERSKLINEYVRSVRLVKLQGWERVWKKRLADAREKELEELKALRYLNALLTFVGSVFNFLLPV